MTTKGGIGTGDFLSLLPSPEEEENVKAAKQATALITDAQDTAAGLQPKSKFTEKDWAAAQRIFDKNRAKGRGGFVPQTPADLDALAKGKKPPSAPTTPSGKRRGRPPKSETTETVTPKELKQLFHDRRRIKAYLQRFPKLRDVIGDKKPASMGTAEVRETLEEIRGELCSGCAKPVIHTAFSQGIDKAEIAICEFASRTNIPALREFQFTRGTAAALTANDNAMVADELDELAIEYDQMLQAGPLGRLLQKIVLTASAVSLGNRIAFAQHQKMVEEEAKKKRKEEEEEEV